MLSIIKESQLSFVKKVKQILGEKNEAIFVQLQYLWKK